MKKSVELKIKIKSLEAEAHIIRHEEKKYTGMDKWHLQHHRKTTVRDAARCSLIAYCHIRGKDATLHFRKNQDDYAKLKDFKSVTAMVTRYGDEDSIKRLESLSKDFHVTLY